VTRRVLVVGGTGGFGRRLVEGLLTTTELEVIIAARHLDQAGALANALDPSRATAIALDAHSVTAEVLRATGAFAVVDAAGPFQGADYRLARAAIAAGMHSSISPMGAISLPASRRSTPKRAAGVVALTGASSTPALSNAVLDELTAGWQRIDSVEIAISPGNRAAPRGLAVIRSILSYAGKPVRIFAEGRWVTRRGWGMLTRRDIGGLGRRWLSLCETPDLDLVPLRFAPRDSAVFRAGLELSVLHLGLALASLPVRIGLLSSLLPYASIFRWLAERLARFGTDRGGMLVEAAGMDANGLRICTKWSLVAAAGDGPVVPTLPALAALRAIAGGNVPAPGARACAGVVDLAAIEREFARHHIDNELARSPIMSPFETILGADFACLPEPVRRLHALTQAVETAGRAEITAAPGLLPWLICRLAGLPRAGCDVPVSVAFHVDRSGGEYWRRRFAGRRYASGDGRGRGHEGLLLERFFPFQLYHRLTPRPDGLTWLLVEWRLLGIPLPGWTLPTVNCFESADGERFVFDIDVRFPIVGRVIHYRGWLVPVEPARERSSR
jgi:NAD(P)-dependent dehydrogenase (short-subunit alcohol dehydrogenase family)